MLTKPRTLSPTSHTWILHNGSPKPFLGHFVTEVQHATLPKTYPTHFYVFEDTTSLQILLSCAKLERLGILQFKVPILVAHSQVDSLSVPTSPAPGSLRKTTKCITFHDLIDLAQPHSAFQTQGLSSLRKTSTSSVKVSFHNPATTINSTKHKRPHLLHYNPCQPLNITFATCLT